MYCSQIGIRPPRLTEMPNLEILNLCSNEICSLHDLFDGMAIDAVNTKLRVLDLPKNFLRSLKANVFSRLTGLVRLNLYDNVFKEVESGAFSGLVNLQELSLSTSSTLDLAVLGDEPDLANLRYLSLNKCTFERSDLLISSVGEEKLFAHCRNRVMVEVDTGFSKRDISLLGNLLKSRICLTFIDRG
jgi:hypothetical protein